MKQEIGLKGIYRFFGTRLAKVLNQYFGVFNPNIITLVGFFIYIIGVGIFAIFCHKLTGSLILFIAGTQLSLVFDFADGSYARMVNRSTQFGHFLDSFIGTLEISILFILTYLVAANPAEKLIVVGLLLIYAFDQRTKLFKVLQKKKDAYVEEKATSNNKNKWNYLMKIPVGFSFAHFYLYVTLWFLFKSIYFLFVLYIIGLLSIVRRLKFLARGYPGKVESV
jgi:phosphatidylglycerophosphate synthase